MSTSVSVLNRVPPAEFSDLNSLLERFRALGCTLILCKPLSENDNSKQQIYVGASFDALNALPYDTVTTCTGVKRPNFKARVRLKWISAFHEAEAPGAQLILYPDYPEVRLSGFLRGCKMAPSAALQPIPREDRKCNNEPDGRVLFLGVGRERTLYAFLAVAGTNLAREIIDRAARNELRQLGVFFDLGDKTGSNAREELIQRLRAIHRAGWHRSSRMYADGTIREYFARNGGGYTLEALCGIRPNGQAVPDYLGWELKAYSGDRITLMTPEPDTGFYAEHGVEQFVRRFGRALDGDVLYFTGTHRVDIPSPVTGLVLRLRGYNTSTGKITDVDGGIELRTADGELCAGWSFARMMEHWGRKHAKAAYVPFTNRKSASPEYQYGSPVLLGEGTRFERLLAALASRHVVFDPGSKVEHASKKPRVKARSQFRISVRELARLYDHFVAQDLN
jgi:hypothetical protein